MPDPGVAFHDCHAICRVGPPQENREGGAADSGTDYKDLEWHFVGVGVDQGSIACSWPNACDASSS